MNINNLSIEILEQIFLHLPLDDRKNASRVCHRWAHAAFSWPCLEVTDLRVISSMCSVQALSTLESSHRNYRNLRFVVDKLVFDARQERALARILHKLRHSLGRLLFIWDVDGHEFDMKILFKISRYIPLLKELCIEDHSDSSVESVSSIVMESFENVEKIVVPSCLMNNIDFDLAKIAPHAQHICVEFTGRHPWEAIQQLSEQLLSLSIVIETACSFRQLWDLKPSRLRKLSLLRECSELMESNGIKFGEASKFFPYCSALTVLELNFHVPNGFIEIITMCCPLLKTLLVCDIHYGWQLFWTLQRLENLTYLTVKEANFEAKNSNISFFKLSSLKYLTLDSIDSDSNLEFFNHLAQCVPNLNGLQFSNYIKFNDVHYNSSILRSLFCAAFTNLEVLVLDDLSCVFPSHLLDHLNYLSGLKAFGLRCYDITPWNRTMIVSSVRKLALEIPLTANREQHIRNVFPSITEIVYTIDDLSKKISPCEFYIPTNRRSGFTHNASNKRN